MLVCRALARGAVLGLLWAGGATAQEGCEFVEGSGNLRTVTSAGGPVTYVSTPNLVCPDGVRIRADSAVSFEASNYVQLIGNVRFEDPEQRMTARSAEYFTTAGRLQAHGGSEIVKKSDGSSVRGEEMVYDRAGPDRVSSQLDVRGDRPTAILYMTSSSDGSFTTSGTAQLPYDVAADRILLEGDSIFRARGGVEIYREDLQAFGDSVAYNQGAGDLRMMSNARMIMNDRELKARTITALLPAGVVEDVEAQYDAILTAEDLRLRAPVVRLFFTDGSMERLVATPIALEAPVPDSLAPAEQPSPGADNTRPVAVANDFEIVADSLDMLAPGEVLERINATGTARAESSGADSLNTPDTPPIALTDWMEGDTIVAMFERAAQDSVTVDTPPDSVNEQYRLERLTAIGDARSFYRIEANDSSLARGERRPSMHYVTADAITLEMDAGAITRMEVTGQTEGVHAEPALIGASADSLATPNDTTQTMPEAPASPTEDPDSLALPDALGAGPARKTYSTRSRSAAR